MKSSKKLLLSFTSIILIFNILLMSFTTIYKVDAALSKKVDTQTISLPEGAKVYFLDNQVGGAQSDAIILESIQNGKAVYAMIDTGRNYAAADRVCKQLEDLNIKELEFILLTHYHIDHMGGLKKIAEKVKIKNFYTKDYVNYCKEGRTKGQRCSK